jgi:hypothetical protein
MSSSISGTGQIVYVTIYASPSLLLPPQIATAACETKAPTEELLSPNEEVKVENKESNESSAVEDLLINQSKLLDVLTNDEDSSFDDCLASSEERTDPPPSDLSSGELPSSSPTDRRE